MRTASDGRGDEAWDDAIPMPADDEATRVFSREDLRRASSDTEATREFTRDPDATRVFSRDASEPTRSDAEQSTFTRKFVRPRPRSRSGPDGHPFHPEPLSGREPAGEDPYVSRYPEYPDHPEPEPFGEGPFDEETEPRPRRPKRRRPRRFRLRRLITLVLLIALAIPPGTWGWVWHTARQDDRTPSDAIIVLGASQYNGVPSPVFEARLRQAQVLYLDGVAPVIVTVGGKQPGDAYTEAAAGRNWLVQVGVPADHVIAVEEGRDTLQSFAAISEVYESNQWETATLVSDPWHSLRSKVMAGDHGIEAGTSPARSGPAVIERSTQLWYITRETASLWYYWIFNDSSDIRVNAA